MAQNTNSKELRQQALRKLAEGRAEMRDELRQARQHLRPSRVLKRVYDRHASLMLTLAVTAGVIPALLFFRGKKTNPPATISASAPSPKSVLGALVVGGLAMLAKSITPTLIKSTVLPHLLSFILKRKQSAFSVRPPG